MLTYRCLRRSGGVNIGFRVSGGGVNIGTIIDIEAYGIAQGLL